MGIYIAIMNLQLWLNKEELFHIHNIGVDFLKIEIGTNEAGQRLDKFLRKYLKDVPLSAIFKALRKGDIRVNGIKKKENYSLELGDVIEIRYIQSKQEKKEDSFFKEVDFFWNDSFSKFLKDNFL